MRLIDADELMEHAGRDRLDSRELIMQMIENAPTVDLKKFKSYVLSIVEQILIDVKTSPNSIGFAVGVAYSDIEHLFKSMLGVGNQKLG